MCYLAAFCRNKHISKHLNYHFLQIKVARIYLFCNFASADNWYNTNVGLTFGERGGSLSLFLHPHRTYIHNIGNYY